MTNQTNANNPPHILGTLEKINKAIIIQAINPTAHNISPKLTINPMMIANKNTGGSFLLNSSGISTVAIVSS